MHLFCVSWQTKTYSAWSGRLIVPSALKDVFKESTIKMALCLEQA